MLRISSIFNAGVQIDRQRNIVAAALVRGEVLRLDRLPALPVIAAGDAPDAVRRSWRVEARRDHHREIKFIPAIGVLQRVEVADVDIDLLPRLDVGHLLLKHVRPLLLEE